MIKYLKFIIPLFPKTKKSRLLINAERQLTSATSPLGANPPPFVPSKRQSRWEREPAAFRSKQATGSLVAT
ncbi:MAG: hypothetical protein COV79_02465 [Parcubacteria group bacterium CG11_big_fil_rev_8_21_14_0_20_41_14]|nr:MAG: hypothetical protein COV79_02465 [Parcubacteria group bacterium CG11_big_fil_rev_8_21_14_0_20_41_14]PIR57199.1 MAG: hypothetical protein COU72_02210 [Parcubacteria group bacterium CG10_big_fil_rev_8_21_14_0_10_41_35]